MQVCHVLVCKEFLSIEFANVIGLLEVNVLL